MIPAFWRRVTPRIHARRRWLFVVCLVAILGLASLAVLVGAGWIEKSRTFGLLFGLFVFLGMEASGLLFAAAWFTNEDLAPVPPFPRVLSAWQFLVAWYGSVFLLLWFAGGVIF